MKKMENKEKLNGLRIGELAKRAAVTPRTIRFYIQEGLLPEPLYTQKNMAYYGEDLVEKVRAIKKAQKERYLPLVVIRKILEENDYDIPFPGCEAFRKMPVMIQLSSRRIWKYKIRCQKTSLRKSSMR